MAFQPEQSTFDTGVYQLELVDPIQGGVGGVSNAPLLNLANRTKWLYDQLELVISGATIPPTVAPLNSPHITGSPIAPTPALGDNSTALSTTAFVQGTVNGVTNKSVAGGVNVTLSAVEAGAGILVLTGALTANIAVIVPLASKQWVVSNQTTGAYSLTVKTASGTGIAVTQGRSNELYCDGTNVLLSTTDFVSPALTGMPTGPTAAAGTNNTMLATTSFAFNLKNGIATVNVAGNVDVTLTAAQYGVGIILLTGALTGSINVIVPPQGGTYVVANKTSGAFSINLWAGGGGTKALVPQGQSVVAYCDGTNVVLAGAAASSSFTLYTFTATAAQTTFNCPYTPGNILVLVNGATIAPPNYTASNGSSVVLNTASNVNDDIQVIAFNSFTVANALTLAGGTMVGPIMLAGGDTGVTPPQFDSSTKLATTAFVQGVGLRGTPLVLVGTSTLAASASGSVVAVTGNGAYTTTLPLLSSIPLGSMFEFINVSPYVMTLSRQGTDLLTVSGSSFSTFALNPGDSVFASSVNGYWVISGSGALSGSSSFGSSLASSGWQKLPSGLIIQWGNASLSSSASSVFYPMTFPNAVYAVTLGQSGTASPANVYSAINGAPNNSGFTASSSGAIPTISFIAIGR